MSATTKTSTSTETTKKEPPTFNEILNKASKSAIRGGTAGAVAMGANVACLMWMRTTVRRACTCWLLGRCFFLFASVLPSYLLTISTTDKSCQMCDGLTLAWCGIFWRNHWTLQLTLFLVLPPPPPPTWRHHRRFGFLYSLPSKSTPFVDKMKNTWETYLRFGLLDNTRTSSAAWIYLFCPHLNSPIDQLPIPKWCDFPRCVTYIVCWWWYSTFLSWCITSINPRSDESFWWYCCEYWYADFVR